MSTEEERARWRKQAARQRAKRKQPGAIFRAKRSKAASDEERIARNREVCKRSKARNKENIRRQKKLYCSKNKDKIALQGKSYREKNREKIARAWKAYHQANREQLIQKRRIRYKIFGAEIREREKKGRVARNRRYRIKNAQKIRVAIRAWKRKKFATDPVYRLENALRCRLRAALTRNIKKIAPTMKLLGCSQADFWIYLESKFESGMTRENYGKVWHVDHIMPVAIFDLTKSEHQKRCFHFSNLQPMFAAENHKKSAKVLTNQFNLL